MSAYLSLLRPLNGVMAGAATVVAAVVSVGAGEVADRWVVVALGALTAFLFTGAGNALNDYYDRETDRANHPNRPIPRGDVSPEGARAVAAVLFVATLPLGAVLGPAPFAVVVINLGVMLSYELTLKRRGLRGNLTIGWLVASLFLFGGLVVWGQRTDALERTAVLAFLAFVATLGREIVKDIEDLAGDVDRTTLPRRIGVPAAGATAAALFVVAVALSFLPFATGLLGPAYLATVAVADLLFLYGAVLAARRPMLSGRAAKYGMLVALVAFVAGVAS